MSLTGFLAQREENLSGWWTRGKCWRVEPSWELSEFASCGLWLPKGECVTRVSTGVSKKVGTAVNRSINTDGAYEKNVADRFCRGTCFGQAAANIGRAVLNCVAFRQIS